MLAQRRPLASASRVAILVMATLLTACSTAEFDTSTRIGRVFTEAWKDASSYEKELLADGELTHAEYEAAKLAAIACARNEGAEVTDLETRPDGQLTYAYGGISDREFDRIDRRCAGRYHTIIDWVWYEITMPSEAERQAIREDFVTCLQDAGVEGVDVGMAFYDAMSLSNDQLGSSDSPAFPCFENFTRGFDEPWDSLGN